MKRVLKKIFFTLSPVLLYTVSGNSMAPTYADGDKILVLKLHIVLKKKDIIILTHPKTHRLLLKRIQYRKEKRYYVIGDNKKESTDSRHFGWVERKNIIGKVLYKLDSNLLH